MTVEEILAALQALVDSANATGEPMPAEDVARYEQLEGMLNARKTSNDLIKRQAARVTTNAPMVTGTDEPADEQISRAFDAYLRSGEKSPLISRALSEGTGSAGGYLVPEGFRDLIVERLKAFGGLQGVASSINTSTGQPLPWVINDDTANSGAIVAENASPASGADLTLSTRGLGAFKYDSTGTGGLPLKVSFELAQDSAFDLAGFIAKKLAMRIARKLAVDFISGSGVGEPVGILSTMGSLSGATALSSNTAPTYADFLAIVHSLDPAYRDNARWLFNDKFLKVIRGIVDTTGRPILWNNTDDATGSLKGTTLLGYPVTIDQACPDPSGSNNFGVFGDVNEAYVVRTVKDVNMLTFNELYAASGQIGYQAWGRFDGTVQDPYAAVLMVAHS